MLVLPTLLLTLSGVSGAGGIALSVKSAVDTIEASATNRQVQERNERNLLRFEACSQKLEDALENLGKQRYQISKNLSVFANAFDKIANKPPNITRGEDTEFPEIDINEIKNVAVAADLAIGTASGTAAGSVFGAAAAGGTRAAVIALGKASTGTKIAALHGAVQNKAALAALGGGAIKYGGGGMALGTLVLNATTMGVGALVQGLAMAYSGSVAKKEADKAKSVLEENDRIIANAIDMQITITCLAEDMGKASVELCNGIYKKSVFQMKELVSKKTDWNTFTPEEQKLVENNILIAKILNYLNNTPMYNAKVVNNADEVEEVEPNTDGVRLAIKKAKHGIERVEK